MAGKKVAPRSQPEYRKLSDDDDDDFTPKGSTKAKSSEDYFGTDEGEVVGKPPVVKGPVQPTRPRVLEPVSLDNRKLSGADRKKLVVWKGKAKSKSLDAFFSRQASEARKQFGHGSVMMGSESDNLIIGIPCPALAFEFVIAQDCFPLGLVMQIIAKHGVGKSALLAEIGRWFDMAGGGMVLCENETKFNPFWYSSILTPEVYDNRVQLHRCKSVEDWQRHLTWATTRMQSDMEGTKKAPGPGRTIPVVLGVDSIMGKTSEENQEKVLGEVGKDGTRGTTGTGFAAPRAHPIEAGSITKYMRTYPQLIDGWPFSLVLINHLRLKNDESGTQERIKTGGVQLDFQESFELELKKIGGHKKKIEAQNFEGVPLLLSCEKNSFGPTHRSVMTRLLWWHVEDPDTGKPVQKTVWDWDWSTVHMLNSQMRGEKASTYLKARLADIGFHLECSKSGDVENRAWSKSVGVSKPEDALSWSEIGALIREDAKLMDKLRDALCISRRPLLAGDYIAQMDAMAQELP